MKMARHNDERDQVVAFIGEMIESIADDISRFWDLQLALCRFQINPLIESCKDKFLFSQFPFVSR